MFGKDTYNPPIKRNTAYKLGCWACTFSYRKFKLSLRLPVLVIFYFVGIIYYISYCVLQRIPNKTEQSEQQKQSYYPTTS